MFKKLLILAAVSFLGIVHAEDVTRGVIGPFLGLNDTDNSITLPAGTAQSILNADVTPGGKSVKKRKGYAQAFALGITTSAVHGVYPFYDSSGNDIVLYFNDTRMSASVNGGTPSLLYSSGTLDSTWQCVDSQGQAYCASTARPGILRTNGATFSFQTIVATGTMVASTSERLVTSGISATPNRIDFSKANDFTVWTVGSQPTDPVQFNITAPGSKITHIVYAHKRIYWFKESSFGYILDGPTLADWVTKVVSPEIGTLNNTSVVREDILYFRGQDGHIYSFDGGTLTKLSRPIGTTTHSAQDRKSNSLTLTSGSDWNAGTFTGNTVFVDTETTAGNLQSTFPDTFDYVGLRDGTSGTKNVWTSTSTTTGAYTSSQSGGNLTITYNSGPLHGGIRTTGSIGVLSAGTTISFTITQLPTGGNGNFSLVVSTFILTDLSGATAGTQGSTAFIKFTPTSASTVTTSISNCYIGGASGTDINAHTSAMLPVKLDLWLSTSNYSYSFNGVIQKQGSHSSSALMASSKNYVYLIYNSVTPGQIFKGDSFDVVPETFTFTSAAQSVSSAITSWDTFYVNKFDAPYGTSAFSLKSAAANGWTSTTAGNIPTISTGTYWQVISTFTKNSYGGVVGASEITQNWFEISSTGNNYATFFDNKILWEVSAGNGATINNKTLVYDLLNQSWTIYDLPANGFYVRNQSLYFGSVSGGYIYKFGDVDSDNGSAINSYWKSKDLFFGDPFLDNELTSISVAADSVASSSMTITYTINGSSSSAYNVSLNSANTFIKSNKNIPAGRTGGLLNIQAGNNISYPWEIFAIGYSFRTKPWAVTQ